MIINRKNIKLFTIIFILIASLSGCGDSVPEERIPAEKVKGQNIEKSVITSDACWVSYTFEEAIDSAKIIFRGKVTEKGDTIVKRYGSKEYPTYFYYTEVKAEVIEGIKGVKAKQKEITFLEHGGETEDKIYVMTGAQKPEIGEEYIFFISTENSLMPPSTTIPISEEMVNVERYITPASIKVHNTNTKDDIITEMSAADYIEEIKAVLNQLETN